jgi:hypothetical protein
MNKFSEAINPSLWPYLMACAIAVVLVLLWNYFNTNRQITLDAAEKVVANGAILGLLVLAVLTIFH